MTPTRLVPVLAAVLAAASAGHALAAPAKPKPVCLQITDETGDARLGGSLSPASVVDSEALDIVSGDIATGRKNLVAAIRLKSLAPETMTTGGAIYMFRWTSGGVQRTMEYREYGDGTAANAVYDADPSSQGTVPVAATRDASTATITFTLPRKLEPSLGKPGAVITDLFLRAYFAVNRDGGYSASGVDEAVSAKKYTDMYPTCLKGT